MNFIKSEYFASAQPEHKNSLFMQMLYAALKSADLTAILLNHKDSIRNIMVNNRIYPTAENTKRPTLSFHTPRLPAFELIEDERVLITNYLKRWSEYPALMANLLEVHAWLTEDLLEEVFEIVFRMTYIADAIELNKNGWGSTLIGSSVNKISKHRKHIHEVINNLDDEELDACDILTEVLLWQSHLAETLDDELSLKLAMQLTNVMQRIFMDLDATAYNEGTKELHLVKDQQEVAVIEVPTGIFRPLQFSRSTNSSGIHHIFEIMQGHDLSEDELKSAFENTLSSPINKTTYRLDWLKNGYVLVHHLNQS